MTYLYLGIAILSEVVATTFLKLSDGFSKPLPSLVTVAGYAVAFYFLSLTLRSLPTGVVYAVWSGVGVVLIATIAWVFQSQKLDTAALCGHGPDRLRGRCDQSVFQRFVAVNGLC
ncbi:small multidrug resistance pump [Bradyrhizobium sp. OAE829]